MRLVAVSDNDASECDENPRIQTPLNDDGDAHDDEDPFGDHAAVPDDQDKSSSPETQTWEEQSEAGPSGIYGRPRRNTIHEDHGPTESSLATTDSALTSNTNEGVVLPSGTVVTVREWIVEHSAAEESCTEPTEDDQPWEFDQEEAELDNRLYLARMKVSD
ncbi:hypothetical protein BU24DRAFT_142922 [Aaosphaeria arxii CBS 175.79]|uniref:Uncharacterized protein n=1 Tax=Aaosphaeria arxii CBS 175.79 TaxID=1450172 RepID=A0A6A5XUM9_9PLEO|nr:uncharacterized protein BU24DRAFT_142922 [Aaosphaeria arxii CBS 175.79]KAF2017065.1 hypothetical protein BU24DRAFT_142922 [Aaosphaeria arxii CBS 175.79]